MLNTAKIIAFVPIRDSNSHGRFMKECSGYALSATILLLLSWTPTA